MPDLPPEVLAWPGLGFGPQPQPAIGPPPQAPPVFGVPHEVSQGLGWQTPPASPVVLESSAAPTQAPDFKVPVEAFAPAPAARPQVPVVRPPTKPASATQQIQQGSDAQQAAVARQGDLARQQGSVDVAKAQDEAASAAKAAKDQQEYEAKLVVRAQDQAKIRQEKQAAIDTAVKAEADYKVDPNRYFKNLSTGKKISSAIGIILAGIGGAMQGNHGPNPALEIIMQASKDDVEHQLREREHLGKQIGIRQGALQNYLQMTKDENSAADLMQAQHLQTAAAELRATASRYAAPNAALDAERNALALEEKAGMLKAGVAEKLAVAEHRARELQISATNSYENIRHNKATEQLTQEQRDIEAAKALAAGKADQAKLIRERGLGGEVKPVKDKDGNVIGSEVGLITQRDGSIFIPQGESKNVSDLIEDHNATTQLVRTLDEIKRLGPEWLTNTANSDKKQRLDQLFGDAKLLAVRAHNLGVPTGRDVELAVGALGTTDPTRFRDSLAGLDSARTSLVRNHNITLKTAGLNKPWDPGDLSSPAPAAETPDDRRLKTALSPRSDDPGASFNPETGKWEPRISGEYQFQDAPTGEVAQRYIDRSNDAIAKQFPDMGEGQRVILEQYGEALAAGDARAAAALSNIADHAPDAGVRAFARQLLTNNLSSSFQRSPVEEMSISTRSPGGPKTFAPAPTSTGLPPEVRAIIPGAQ